MARPLITTALAVAALSLTACAPAPLVRTTAGASSEPASAPASTAATFEATTQAAPVQACLAEAQALTPEEQAGQLLMVGVATTGLDQATTDAIRLSKAGSVVLLGDSSVPRTDITGLTAAIGALGSAELPILVSVDQEGGQVQRLQGTGFTRIPSAVDQGQMNPAALRSQVETWADELRRSGVRFNLAPVADVVDGDDPSANAPIGKLQRHYGADPATAAGTVASFVEGMEAKGVATSLKHFPGLGRVTANTDFAEATDDVTVMDDAAWQPFVDGIAAGASTVMISSATFTQLDPDHQAVFSQKVITDILRDHLGFDGVVIADDLGAAGAVKDTPPGERAVLFLAAGGDLVINADPALATEMSLAIVQAMEDPVFAEQVTESVARVLALKEHVGTIDCG